MALFEKRARQRVVHSISRWLPELNFITLHYLYFFGTCLISALVFWGSSTPAIEISFTDSLFLSVSAMTESGLNTVNLSQINTWQQIILFLLMILGSAIFVSSSTVYIRRRAFERRFLTELEKQHGLGKRIIRSFSRGRAGSTADFVRMASHKDDNLAGASSQDRRSSLIQPESNTIGSESGISPRTSMPLSPGSQSDKHERTRSGSATQSALDGRSEHISFQENARFRNRVQSNDSRSSARLFGMNGVGARSGNNIRGHTVQSTGNLCVMMHASTDRVGDFPVFSDDEEKETVVDKSVGRNSAFSNLTYKERERLGGVEFKAVVFLSWLVPIYFVTFQLLASLSLGAFVASYYSNVTRENGLNPWWVGIFNAVSAFNNNGMSLLDANMIAFSRAVFMLLSMSLLILAGNTCFPIFLRLAIWTIQKALPKSKRWADLKNTLAFLLEHPRRCFTNLFPSQHTWWLLWSVVLLNGIDCIFFVILNIGNKKITNLEPGYEFLDGLFQAVAVRSGGFYVVPIANTRISLQVLYVIMMYISAFPIAITIRNSNVYEERSLGIYSDDPGYDHVVDRQPKVGFSLTWIKQRITAPDNTSSRRYFVQQQLRAQLAHDLWWLGLAVFLIMIIESASFERDPAVYSVFNVIFETVSAYGTVGISVGLPDQAYSFCGDFHTLSKLILCAVMLRGRHRGLPVAIDKAVLLPQDHATSTLEDEDARIRRERTLVAGTVAPC